MGLWLWYNRIIIDHSTLSRTDWSALIKKLIALTGSFNPVTVAHYKILSDAVERYGADEGIFIATDDKYLARKSLLKNKTPSNFILPETVRGEMLRSLSNREKNEYTNDERIYFDNEGCLTSEGRAIESNKIRTLFRIALENGHDSMVLGAFGCGVYNLHSDEVSFKAI